MKKLAHKISLALLFILISSALSAKKKSAEKEKLTNELIVLKASEKIEVNTKFGELKINTWDKNEVSIKISVKVKDGNDKKAQELIDRIIINISHTPSKLSIRTDISGDDDEIKIKTDKDGYLEINYELIVPKNNELDVTNAFGAFILGNMNANVALDLKFGAATLGELNGNQNDLSLEFCDPAVINYFNKGKIDLKFSKLELIRGNDLELKSEMSGSKIENVSTVDCSLKFGSLKINTVKDVELNSQMSTIKIDSLQNMGDIVNKYGTLKIENVLPNVQSLTVEGEFSPIRIGLDSKTNYKVTAEAKMSGLKLPKGSILEEQEYNSNNSQPAISTTNSFKGRIGEKSSGATVLKINSSFGEIKISREE